MKPVRAAMGEIIKGFSSLHQATMKEGALSAKDKELIALAIGLAVRVKIASTPTPAPPCTPAPPASRSSKPPASPCSCKAGRRIRICRV